MTEILAGGFDAERRGDERIAFLAQRVNCLLLADALGSEPGIEFAPRAIAAVMVVGRRRVGRGTGDQEFGIIVLLERAQDF